MLDMLAGAKDASKVLGVATTAVKNDVLRLVACRLDDMREEIITANRIDLDDGERLGLSDALLDRLKINDARIDAMIQGVHEIIALSDPVGTVLDGRPMADGLKFSKVAVPLGLICIIYESRPNVTIDAATLCIKSGNAVLLRGGKEALHSNRILANIVKDALSEMSLPSACVSFVDDTDRNRIIEIVKSKDYIDLVVPRGGPGLIDFVVEHSLVPIVKHDKGLCHVYVDESADVEQAVDIVYNAKVQRPGVCNAAETLLIHKDCADNILPSICDKLVESGVELRGCELARGIYDMKMASDEDWDTEYLDLIINVKVVPSVEDAIAHIDRYGSNHSEAIVTKSIASSEMFLNLVDASCVFLNASTRFNDGGMLGMGAELGISTQKLHCRGPMGINDLTTYKYVVRGSGNIRE